MDPVIRYTRTSDEVSIAFAEHGTGTPVLDMGPLGLRNIEATWQIPEERVFLEALGEGRQLIQFDPRGMGLSQREINGASLEAYILDIEAVLDAVGTGPVTLFAAATSGPIAVGYAARHPERVSGLILYCTALRSEAGQPAEVAQLLDLAKKDWNLFTEAAVHAAFGWSSAASVRRYAGLLRATLDPSCVEWLPDLLQALDATPFTPDVRCPTLVIHRRELESVPLAEARKLAAAIPGARLTVLPGSAIAPAEGDGDSLLRAIDDFVGDGAGEVRTAPMRLRPGRAPVAILFTDIEGSTALTESLGDARAREIMREHDDVVRRAVQAHAGTEVKSTGDGFLVTFLSITAACECAVAIQSALAAGAGSGSLRVRIGINAGEPVVENDDVFGTAVNLAARIADHAAGGTILVSDVVRQLSAGASLAFDEHGEVTLAGYDRPVRLHRLHCESGTARRR